MDDSIPKRRCPTCGETKPLTADFWSIARRNKNGFFYECRICRCIRAHRKSGAEVVYPACRWSPSGEKWCIECGFPKSQSEFYRMPSKDGLQPRCKACSNSLHKAYVEQNRERLKSYMVGYNVSRKDERKAYYVRTYRRRLVYYAGWRARNPLRIRCYNTKRRARLCKAGGTFRAEDITAQLESQKGICWWCHKKIEGKFNIDHRIPISRGGSNRAENIVITHESCNKSKHDKMPWEYNGRLL